MNNKQIVELLRRHDAEKKALLDTREEMMKLCVEQLGLPKSDMMKIDTSKLLEGYLICQGVMQEWRKAEVSTADGHESPRAVDAGLDKYVQAITDLKKKW